MKYTNVGRSQAASRRRRIAGGLITAALILMALAMVAGVAGPFGPAARASDASASPDAGKVVLRIGMTDDVDNLNPFVGYTEPTFEVNSQTYEFLVERNPADFGTGKDGVAESWEVSPDGLTWTFHLHKDIKWQDGPPLTADDVAFTYNYIIDNPMGGMSSAAKGITKAVKVDDYTVQLVTDKPKSNILRLWIPILPKHIWEKVPPKVAASTYKSESPVGSGPFRVVEWKRGSYVRMEANKDYWQGAPKVDELMFITYKNPSTMVADLVAGRLAAAQGVPQAEFTKLQNTPGILAWAYRIKNWDYLNYNCYASPDSLGNPVLKDPKFRVALDTAIDRDKLVAIAYGGEAVPGTTIMPPGQWQSPDFHWEPPAGTLRTFDPEKAKSLLDAAGYKDANGDGVREYKGKPITLRLWALTGATQSQTAGKMIAGWFKDIGLNIKYEVVDEGVYNDSIWNYKGATFSPDYDMYLWSWTGYADPGQTLDAYTTAQIEGWNEPAWSNAEYDRYVALQAAQLDPQKRADEVYKAQEAMYGDAPLSVTVYPKFLQAINTAAWTGWIDSGIGGTGPKFFLEGTPKTYLNVAVNTAGAQTAGSSSSWIWVVVAIVLVIIVVAVLFLVRRSRRTVEES